MTYPARQLALEGQQPERLYWLRMQSMPPGVYIIGYHSIHGANPAEWERAYGKVASQAEDLRAHLEWLCAHMTPLSLPELTVLPPEEYRRRAFFVLTFDDGYKNLLPVAMPIAAQFPVTPTVFVNGDFASGEKVYFRVLSSLLAMRGQQDYLLKAMQEVGLSAPPDAVRVFDHLKNSYQYPQTEEAVARAWKLANPSEAYPPAHLSWDELRQLSDVGWHIGNHTRGHVNLVELDAAGHNAQIIANETMMRDAGLVPIPWLALPNGHARHVNRATSQWLDAHPDYHALFDAGGVNLEPSRKEWFRVGVGDFSLKTLRRQLKREVSRSRRLSSPQKP